MRARSWFTVRILAILVVLAAGLAPAAAHQRVPEFAGSDAGVQSESSPGRSELPFERAQGRRAWSFPRDHGQHPRFRLEWWYYTGIVRTQSGRAFGYQVTFFRRGLHAEIPRASSAWRAGSLYLAHLALSDLERGAFRYAARTGRDSLAMNGADLDRHHVWLDGWSVEPVAGEPLAFRLVANDRAIGLTLTLAPTRPPLLHGRGGLDRKGEAPGQASWYYSLPRLETTGEIRVEGERWQVRGTSWMDHEFGTSQLAADQAGWDWMSMRLDNGMDLMLYRLRSRDGSVSPMSGGTLSDGKGRPTRVRLAAHLDEKPQLRELWAAAVPTGTWASPKSGARYPLFWSVTLPGAGLTLTVRPAAPDQEIRPGVGVPFGYWEGAVWIRGEQAGRPVSGEGYLELTGYAGELGSAFR